MPRKANNAKNTPFTLEMAEVYFGVLQNDFRSLKEEMNSKFAAVYGRFEKIDQRFEKIDQRFEKIDQRFEKIDKRLGVMEGSLNTILKINQEDRLEAREIKSSFWDHDRRLLKLEKIIT